MKQKSVKKKYFWYLKQSLKDWKFWVKLLIGLAQVVSIIIFLIVSAAIEGDIFAIPANLSFFTTLSNLFCGIFFIYSALFHHREGHGKFDNSEVAKIAIIYVTLTIIFYNLDQIMSKDPYIFSSWKFLMSFICEHSVGPFLAIIYYLFFYNHKNICSIKEFSRKWVWYMIAGLIIYLTVFSAIGFLARILNWRPLFGTVDGSGEYSTFPYPFMDWYHGVGFFKFLHPWAECFVMLTATVILNVAVAYFYSFLVIRINKNRHLEERNEFEQNLAVLANSPE